MTSRSTRSRLGAAGGGAVASLTLWLAFTITVWFRSMCIAPVPPIAATAAQLPPHDETLPTAVVLLSQAGTEITDFLAPFAILRASGAFNVYAVAPSAEPAPMYGGVGILPQLTLAAFDAAHPRGADLVVIPNVMDPENPVLVDWVARQARGGALSASICEGARLLARTGLIDGREATTHWAAVEELRKAFPEARWRNDVRYVADGPIVMSAGVTAAIDASLHLVTRFAGADAAARTARELGLPPLRDAAAPAPSLGAPELTTAVANAVLGWPQAQVRVRLVEGVDEIDLAAALDSYARTFEASVASTSPQRRPVLSRRGLVLVPLLAAEENTSAIELNLDEAGAPAFDRALAGVAQRFGGATAGLVAVQLQYPAAHLELAAAPNPRAAHLAVLAAVLLTGAAAGRLLQRWRTKRDADGVDAFLADA